MHLPYLTHQTSGLCDTMHCEAGYSCVSLSLFSIPKECHTACHHPGKRPTFKTRRSFSIECMLLSNQYTDLTVKDCQYNQKSLSSSPLSQGRPVCVAMIPPLILVKKIRGPSSEGQRQSSSDSPFPLLHHILTFYWITLVNKSTC